MLGMADLTTVGRGLPKFGSNHADEPRRDGRLSG
jgi:hypothetical protein